MCVCGGEVHVTELHLCTAHGSTSRRSSCGCGRCPCYPYRPCAPCKPGRAERRDGIRRARRQPGIYVGVFFSPFFMLTHRSGTDSPPSLVIPTLRECAAHDCSCASLKEKKKGALGDADVIGRDAAATREGRREKAMKETCVSLT